MKAPGGLRLHGRGRISDCLVLPVLPLQHGAVRGLRDGPTSTVACLRAQTAPYRGSGFLALFPPRRGAPCVLGRTSLPICRGGYLDFGFWILDFGLVSFAITGPRLRWRRWRS